ncbi:Uncharacterised protein [Mycolicibacterium fortuitum]|uniref:Uncharacterized protein n=1 Tax=Mycolicibacterium fortuitum TaxID=1766 RepID=A0A378UV20_MYCFO|nr:Uncharacterised protein [Mycolicibacterium fortuitum]
MPTLPVRTTAPYGVDTASARIAACSSGTLSGTRVRPTAWASVYSAHAPSYANAINWIRMQLAMSPRLQFGQAIHGRPAATMTRSPSAQPVTSGPSLAMVPEASCPWVTTGACAGKVPLIKLRSEWQIPQNATLTRTSPGPGSGIGTSSTTTLLVSA